MACLVSGDTDDLYQWGENDGESDVSSTDEEDAISEEEAGLDSDPGMYDSSWVFFWVVDSLSSTNKLFLSGACPGLKERFEAKNYRLCAVRFLEL